MTTKTTLTDKIVQEIRKDILDGYFKPEQKLLLSELQARYGVGSSPIREALLHLTWHKYVILKPQRGFWVAPISVDELNNILLSRQALDTVVIPIALERGDEEWELSVLAAYHKLIRLDLDAQDIDYQQWRNRHIQFHLSIIEGAKSDVFYDLYESLYRQLERYRHLWFNQTLPNEQRYHDDGTHQQILDAALSRNAEKMKEILIAHYSQIICLIDKKNS